MSHVFEDSGRWPQHCSQNTYLSKKLRELQGHPTSLENGLGRDGLFSTTMLIGLNLKPFVMPLISPRFEHDFKNLFQFYASAISATVSLSFFIGEWHFCVLFYRRHDFAGMMSMIFWPLKSKSLVQAKRTRDEPNEWDPSGKWWIQVRETSQTNTLSKSVLSPLYFRNTNPS